MRIPVGAQRSGLFAVTAALVVAGMAGTAAAAPSTAATPARPAVAGPAVPQAGPRFVAPPKPAHVGTGVRQACPTPAVPGRMQCQALLRTNGTTRAGVSGAAVQGGYGPANLQAAYGLTTAAANNGTGETVAIVDAYNDPRANHDLYAYRSAAGLPSCTEFSGCLTVVNQSGGSTLPGTDPSGGWEFEESLDLDMVSAICPKCHILLVEASSPTITNLGKAENYAAKNAKFVSDSWGSGGEFLGENSFDKYFNHSGVAIVAASGDSGYGTQYPAVSQFVTSVGGTTLTSSNGTYSETAWGGTGSGCGVLAAKPSWQQGASALGGCPNRTETDVAATANPNNPVAVYDTYSGYGGWNSAGGTSVATAIIAGVYALAGSPAAGTYPASYPYLNTSAFHDITSGSDGSCRPTYLCQARTGYDGPTGWGTPNGIAGFTAPSGDVVTVEDPGTLDYKLGANVNVQLSAHDSQSANPTFTYSASGLPSGLSISSSNGIISGKTAAAGTATVTVTATHGTASGKVTFTIVTIRSLRTKFHQTYGHVRLAVNGKCLNDRRNKTWNGNKIQTWSCGGYHRERFTFVPDAGPGAAGTLRIHGKCVAANGTSNGSKVVLWTCNGHTNEQWFLAGFGQLVNQAANKCLVGSRSGTNGNQVWIWKCTGHANQAWQLPASPVQSGVTGKCLNDRNNASYSGNVIQIWTCDGYARQKWVPEPDGTIRIHGKCLTAPPHTWWKVKLEKCHEWASRVWLVGPSGELISVKSGKCLADPGNSTTNGTAIRERDCYGRAGEIWALT